MHISYVRTSIGGACERVRQLGLDKLGTPPTFPSAADPTTILASSGVQYLQWHPSLSPTRCRRRIRRSSAAALVAAAVILPFRTARRAAAAAAGKRAVVAPPPLGLRLVCVSDTHGRHRHVNVPPGDILIHAGDFTHFGKEKDVTDFNDWLGEQDHSHKIVINDWLGEQDHYHNLATRDAGL